MKTWEKPEVTALDINETEATNMFALMSIRPDTPAEEHS